MRRLYDALVPLHFEHNRQMLFLSGPRQVGKTTAARAAGERFDHAAYLNWDDVDARETILSGTTAIAEAAGLGSLRPEPPLLILDEIHRYRDWKPLLKGLFDVRERQLRIVVTGSARLDVFGAGGESLMGRYLRYRMHPLSVGELLDPVPREELVARPRAGADEALDRLYRWGGFPEPLVRASPRFARQWRNLRDHQLFREELRDLTRIQHLGQTELLARLVRERVGQLTSYASLSRQVRVGQETVRRWLDTLSSLYWCFAVRPWHRNVSRSLRKEPKYYLWDWSQVADEGARRENLVASALLKAVHFWTDHGLGDCALHFLRNKDRREVDFVVVRDGRPWFLVEVKSKADGRPSSSLAFFQEQLGAPHAFQAAFDLPFIDVDCFSRSAPVEVPASTLLSQLV